jgi:hypothetical protein
LNASVNVRPDAELVHTVQKALAEGHWPDPGVPGDALTESPWASETPVSAPEELN